MGPDEIAFIKAVVLLVIGVGAARTGVQLWIRARHRTLAEADTQAIAELREDQQQLQTYVMELEERLDFTERRLLQYDEPPTNPEPRQLTPV